MPDLFDPLPSPAPPPEPEVRLRPGQPRIHLYGPKDRGLVNRRIREGVTIINTTSHSDDWGRQLSPFLLGPVPLYDEHVALCVENGWQYSKLYAAHADAEGHVTPAYWKWARAGWANPRAVRYPMGKGVRPLCSLWNGERLTYIEARKQIFVSLYRFAVSKTLAWKRLVEMLRRGEPIHLWDFDAYDYQAEGLTVQQALNNPDRIFGHGMVLALMLEQEWV